MLVVGPTPLVLWKSYDHFIKYKMGWNNYRGCWVVTMFVVDLSMV